MATGKKAKKDRNKRIVCPVCGAPRSEWNPAVSIAQWMFGQACGHCGAPTK